MLPGRLLDPASNGGARGMTVLDRIRLTADCDHSSLSSYLVTGGAGFIGSHLAEELLKRGHRVRIADSLITGRRSNLDVNKAAEFLEGDLGDAAFAERACAGVDYVLHQAAIPSVPRSVDD